jgi:hypothetical protein
MGIDYVPLTHKRGNTEIPTCVRNIKNEVNFLAAFNHLAIGSKGQRMFKVFLSRHLPW